MGDVQTFTGIVRTETRNRGSKSEHEAIVIDIGDGQTFKIFLRGGNPFRDSVLEQFIGKSVTLSGRTVLDRADILVDSIDDIKPVPQQVPKTKNKNYPKL